MSPAKGHLNRGTPLGWQTIDMPVVSKFQRPFLGFPDRGWKGSTFVRLPGRQLLLSRAGPHGCCRVGRRSKVKMSARSQHNIGQPGISFGRQKPIQNPGTPMKKPAKTPTILPKAEFPPVSHHPCGCGAWSSPGYLHSILISMILLIYWFAPSFAMVFHDVPMISPMVGWCWACEHLPMVSPPGRWLQVWGRGIFHGKPIPNHHHGLWLKKRPSRNALGMLVEWEKNVKWFEMSGGTMGWWPRVASQWWSFVAEQWMT